MEPAVFAPERQGDVVSADPNLLSKECWVKAYECFGTAKVFERRARHYRRKLNILSYLGILVPLFFGAAVASWGSSALLDGASVIILSVAGLAQTVGSGLALIHNWAAEYAYCNQSVSVNFQLSNEFKILAPKLVAPTPALKKEFDRLLVCDRNQAAQDNQKLVTDPELARGHRHALIQFKCACATCGIEPKDMKPTKCKTCGKF